MKIGIDAKFAASRYGGLGAYTINIINKLVGLGQDEIIAFVPSTIEAYMELPDKCSNLQIVPFKIEKDLEDFYKFRVHWEQNILKTLLAENNVDVFFNPAFMAPLGWDGPKVVTIHDLLFEYSDHFNSTSSIEYYTAWAKRCAKSVDAIITVSNFTANDVHKLWNINDIPVETVHIAPSLPFIPEDRVQSQITVQKELGIHAPYLLYVGDSFPRKNLQRLIQAYISLKRERPSAPHLVLVTASIPAELHILLMQQALLDQVIVTGHCGSHILPHVYAAAEMLIYPSLFEGFGLPPIEAMACGTPVITSHVSAIPEIVQNAALLVNPRNIYEIKEAMLRLLTDKELQSTLSRRGRKHVQNFSWETTAQKTRKILECAAQMRLVKPSFSF